MKHRVLPFLIGLLLGPLAACGDVTSSRATQLTAQNIPCWRPSSDLVDDVLDGLPVGFLDGWIPSNEWKAGTLLVGVPSRYRDYLVSLYRRGTFAGVFPKDLPEGVMGVTNMKFTKTWTDGDPTWIHISTKSDGLDWALQHEVGHALRPMIARSPEGQEAHAASRVSDFYLREGVNNEKLRAYARSSADEFWAEAFNNYYCSRESREFFRRELPGTFAFFSSFLEFPPFARLMTGHESP